MKKVLGMIAVIVASTTSAAIAEDVVRRAPSGSSVAKQVEEDLKTAAAQLRTTLPVKIDDTTTLTDVGHSGTVHTFYYKVSTRYERDPNFFEIVREITTDSVCKSEGMKRSMQSGAVYRYSYSNSQSKLLAAFDLKATSCK
jgi:hypothetical protein